MREIVTVEKWDQVNAESKALLKELHLTLRQEGRSKSTIEAYMGNCKRFLVWALDNAENRSVLELKKKDFRNYSLYLREEAGVSTASHNSYVSAVKNWCERLEDDDETEYMNACRKIKGVKIERVRKITFLTDGEIEHLYKELIRRKKYEKAMFLALAYDSTARRAELMQVEKEGFLDPTKNHTNEVTKKGGKKEVLIYFDRSKEAAALYLAHRGEDDNPLLWTTYRGQPRTPDNANSWCAQMSEILSELEGRKISFTPHAIRHSAIENLTEGSHYKCEVKRIPYDIQAVSKLASHASTDMTQYYKKDKGLKSIESAFGVKVS